MRPFLRNLFADPDIIGAPAIVRLPLAELISRTRAKSARANYAMMGGGSPILAETQAQAAALKAALRDRRPDDEIEVFIAMRYWSPQSEGDRGGRARLRPRRDRLLPLYPQFSTTTTKSSLAEWAAVGGPDRSGGVLLASAARA